MIRDVIQLSATSPVAEAARLMADRRVRSVVVVDDQGNACGIVTERDIVVRAVARGENTADTRLGDICSTSVLALGPDTTLSDAVDMMREKGVERLPVIKGGRPVGIITLGDLPAARDYESVLGSMGAGTPSV